MDSIVVFGCGGHSKVVSDVIQREGNYKIEAYYDENPKSKIFLGSPVFSSKPDLQTALVSGNIKFAAIAIGNNEVRRKLSLMAQELGLILPVIVDPSAIISQNVRLGMGTIVMPGAIVNADTQIQEGTILNTASVVEHDCMVGAYTHVAPGSVLCGGVQVGEMSLIGARTVAIPLMKIGAYCSIGAGSVIVRAIPNNSCAYGNPARVKQNK
ncbi:acetyltransferase [Bdellovibrio bacteriovorus]|uniref:acetyltransferase n=1 Tax=Bdellovibrio bacteriovorus TaxID=959 RepID=UPI0035A5B36D